MNMNEKLGTIFPVTFGGFAGGFKGLMLNSITLVGIIDCIIYAIIGAIVGYIVKTFLDYIKQKYQISKKRKERKEKKEKRLL